MKLFYHVFILMTVKNIAAQEPINASPPNGVKGPKNFVDEIPKISFMARRYKLPENSNIPNKKYNPM